jgi:SAM-dependent methyltransferase
MQGHVCLRPHGYFGDFEIIDRIYAQYASADPSLTRWDTYFQAGTAAVAVRNRKTYLHEFLARHRGEMTSMLNVAAGPCRDLKEAYEQGLLIGVDDVVCLDSDPAAVAYARDVLIRCEPSPQFVTRNALRYRDERRFSLVWSAGLFDYLADAVAVRLLKRLVSMCAPRGKVVVGNFSTENTQRFYMEFGGWDLIYRDESDLRQLAIAAGVARSRLHVEAEPTGVNLFLIIEC